MESKRTHDELKEILDRNTAWIENCDSKTSIILGSFGVIAGIFLATDYVSKFKSILCHMASRVCFWMVIYIIFYILTISIILAGCVCWLIRINLLVSCLQRNDLCCILFSPITELYTLRIHKSPLLGIEKAPTRR